MTWNCIYFPKDLIESTQNLHKLSFLRTKMIGMTKAIKICPMTNEKAVSTKSLAPELTIEMAQYRSNIKHIQTIVMIFQIVDLSKVLVSSDCSSTCSRFPCPV